MARLPFDPDRIELPPDESRTSALAATGATGGGGGGGGTGGTGGTDRPLTVGEVAALIREALVLATPRKIRVVGQVSNFTDRSHWFFSLKDEQATIRCVCFASTARRLKMDVADGLEVVATGRLDFYDTQGHVQLYVDKIEPVGQGALELRYRALCDELRKLGYFDPGTKLPLPSFARRIAVVTSRSAAALQDVIDTARRRWPGCRLLLFDVRVQGEQAAPQIAEAILALSRGGGALGIDAVILTRGGGSIEDLWAFNERIVADAIHAGTLPIVAAIGHESDTTIAELVADVRCATPTQAAMRLVPDAGALRMQLNQYGHRLTLLLKRQVEHGRQRADAVARHPLLRRPGTLADAARQRLARTDTDLVRALGERLNQGRRLVAEHRHALASLEPRSRLRAAQRRLSDHGDRLVLAMGHKVRDRRSALEGLQRHLDGVGPQSVLRRGYSYTLDTRRKMVRTVGQVGVGQRITTVLPDGSVHSTVTGTERSGPHVKDPGSDGAKKSEKAKGADQLELFEVG